MTSFEQQMRQVCLSVRDWGKSLAKQEFDDDPIHGMDVKTATEAILAAHEVEADRRVLEELQGIRARSEARSKKVGVAGMFDSYVKGGLDERIAELAAQLQPHTPTKEDV